MDDDRRVYLINPKTNLCVESVNKELIEHNITQWRHRDSCPDCAANPQIAAQVQAGERANAAALTAMLPFFKGNPDPTVLLQMWASGFIAFHQEMNKEPVDGL